MVRDRDGIGTIIIMELWRENADDAWESGTRCCAGMRLYIDRCIINCNIREVSERHNNVYYQKAVWSMPTRFRSGTFHSRRYTNVLLPTYLPTENFFPTSRSLWEEVPDRLWKNITRTGSRSDFWKHITTSLPRFTLKSFISKYFRYRACHTQISQFERGVMACGRGLTRIAFIQTEHK